MLTRLKVSGFKNLLDVDVRFGPFTCIAGPNGVGKSNLLDAITFLSDLADKPLIEAARSVRDQSGRRGEVRNLFSRVGDRHSGVMEFLVEMVVPLQGTDDLGLSVKASVSFLRYKLEIRHRQNGAAATGSPLEIRHESLERIKLGEAWEHLLFPHNKKWRQSAVSGLGRKLPGHRTAPFISTSLDEGAPVIKIHQDQTGGRPLKYLAPNLPKTILSSAAAEIPTAALARAEMRSWRLLQLEPGALRQPDGYGAETRLNSNGAHLAATLHRLASAPPDWNAERQLEHREAVFARIANQLSELIDVREISIAEDDKRELYQVIVRGRDGTAHPAMSLSDGTLRFLALAVLAEDPSEGGLICLEEPENGIHPERVTSMLELLQSIATDPQRPVSDENPLRQVIINTHSPVVAAETPAQDLMFASQVDILPEFAEGPVPGLALRCVSGTWRETAAGMRAVSRGTILNFLKPVAERAVFGERRSRAGTAASRLIDQPDLQSTLHFEDPD